MMDKRNVRARRPISLVFGSVLVATATLAGLAVQPASATHIPYAVGDVFAGVGTGKIKHFSPTGALIEVLDTTSGSNEDTGMCFDAGGQLRATNFSANNMTLFDNKGAVLQQPWAGPFNAHPESCVVDASGNVYVGQADGSGDVLKFSPTGTLLASYDVARQGRGSDWIDLAADQKTLFYTSEGSLVKRFDVSANVQLPDFATGLPGPCFALRIRANGEVMVACLSAVVRLSATGSVIQTYPAANYGASFLFALNVDPDGTTLWTADIFTGDVVHIDIATGTQLLKFNAGRFTTLAGLAIFGEPTASVPNNPCASATPGPGDIVGTAGNDKITGTPGNDRIFGLGGDDQIAGLGGDDVIFGGAGNDQISGGDGNDTLCGGDGVDWLSGGNGNDKLFGEDGNDDLSGGAGDDTLDGGLGNDRLAGGTGTNTMHGGGGTDSCVNPPASTAPCPA